MSDQDEIISDDEVSPGAWFMLEIFIKQILGDRTEPENVIVKNH